MSIFASQTSQTIPIPGAAPHTVTIRKLTAGELDAAQGVHLRTTLAGRWAPHGWAAQFTQHLAKGTATPVEAERVLSDPLNGYDRHTLVKAGLVAWSVPDPVLSPEAIDDLDDDTLEFFAREILQVSKPSLFRTPEEAEAARKNASGFFTSV